MKAYKGTKMTQTIKVHAHRSPKNFIAMALAAVAFSVIFSQENAFATNVTAFERRKQIVDLYIKNEFSNGNIKLRKFELVGAIAVIIECGSLEKSVCQQAKQVLNETFEPSANVRLIPSSLGVISIVFDNSTHVEGMLPIAVKDYASGVSDTSDRQCAMFYQYADSTIQRGKIFVSTDQPSNKLRACLIVQIGRLLGPGFSQTDRFSDIWRGLLSRSSDDRLKRIAHIYGILEYMHMCPELVAGMSEFEARRALIRADGCMSKLEGIK